MWYTKGNLRSSRPHDLTNWNGLNFSRSINNADSRLEQVYNYLATYGPRTKRQILADVFAFPETRMKTLRGQHSDVFGLAVKHGILSKVRKDGTTYWVTAKGTTPYRNR